MALSFTEAAVRVGRRASNKGTEPLGQTPPDRPQMLSRYFLGRYLLFAGDFAGLVFGLTFVVLCLEVAGSYVGADLHRTLLENFKTVLIELGRDFCFVVSEFPLWVANRDFALDLLFFHRGLICLVAIGLKVGRFEPEFLGKLDFYPEGLDRDVRKEHEKPSIGVSLCASKDDEVVEYTLSRSLSPLSDRRVPDLPSGQENATGEAPRVL